MLRWTPLSLPLPPPWRRVPSTSAAALAAGGASPEPETSQLSAAIVVDANRSSPCRTRRVFVVANMEQSPLAQQPRPEVFERKIVRLYEELFAVGFEQSGEWGKRRG